MMKCSTDWGISSLKTESGTCFSTDNWDSNVNIISFPFKFFCIVGMRLLGQWWPDNSQEGAYIVCNLLSFAQNAATLTTPSISRPVENLSTAVANTYCIWTQYVSGNHLSTLSIAIHLLRKSGIAAICWVKLRHTLANQRKKAHRLKARWMYLDFSQPGS